MQVVRLVITATPDGNVRLDGPLENRVLCYGLLEQARDLVKDYDPQAAPKIVLPEGRLPNPNGV